MHADARATLFESLLSKRGLDTEESREAFLHPQYEAHLHDPFLLTDIDIAATRIFTALENGERIAIYADFDCDGIPAAVVLNDFFEKIGYEHIEVYIPHRDVEGYGFHIEAIDKLKERGVSLIITVDVGITAVDAVEHARSLGIDVIVTDHHEMPDTLPAAVAVVNPKRDSYPFPHLCGSAVAYKLVQVLLARGRAQGVNGFDGIPEGWEKWLLDMIGIATIADMVPLVGENRVLAHFGLMVLRKSPRPGIAALVRKLRIRQDMITEDDVGFSIAPRINAASRMGEPEAAFRVLATKRPEEAEQGVSYLETLNSQRKGAVASTVREARKRVRERGIDSRVLVMGDPKWRPALLGLVANSMLDECGGIVCLWGSDASGRLKGSCRSDGSASVVDLFAKASHVLEQYGGHHASGGFSVSRDMVHELPAVFEHALPEQAARADNKVGEYDAEVPLGHLNESLYRFLTQLAPFGEGNPRPVFLVSDAQVEGVRQFGKHNEHLDLQITDGNGARLRAIRFFTSPEQLRQEVVVNAPVRLIASLEQSVFRGTAELRLRLVDTI